MQYSNLTPLLHIFHPYLHCCCCYSCYTLDIAIVCTILLYIINHPYLYTNLTSLPAQQSHIPTHAYIHTYIYIHIHTYCNCYHNLVIYHQSSLPAHQSHIPTCTPITHPYTFIHTYIHTYTYILQLLSQSCYTSSIIPTCTPISHPYLHTNLTSLVTPSLHNTSHHTHSTAHHITHTSHNPDADTPRQTPSFYLLTYLP